MLHYTEEKVGRQAYEEYGKNLGRISMIVGEGYARALGMRFGGTKIFLSCCEGGKISSIIGSEGACRLVGELGGGYYYYIGRWPRARRGRLDSRVRELLSRGISLGWGSADRLSRLYGVSNRTVYRVRGGEGR